MARITLLFFIIFCAFQTATAQNSSIKISAIQTRFSGNLETDSSGNALENLKSQYGFSIALATDYEFSAYSGFRTEIAYGTRKYERNYAGSAYRIFDKMDSTRVYARGNLASNAAITHHYFDLPLMFYFRTDDNENFGLEVAFGPQVSYLFQTSAKGQATFSGNTEGGARVPEYTTQLKQDYESDDEKTVEFSNTMFDVDNGGRITVPQVTGAYYDVRTSQFNRFNKFDVSLNADVAIWLTKKLGIRFRANFGLLDITNDQGDFKASVLDSNKSPISRSARNTLTTMQLGLNIRL